MSLYDELVSLVGKYAPTARPPVPESNAVPAALAFVPHAPARTTQEWQENVAHGFGWSGDGLDGAQDTRVSGHMDRADLQPIDPVLRYLLLANDIGGLVPQMFVPMQPYKGQFNGQTAQSVLDGFNGAGSPSGGQA